MTTLTKALLAVSAAGFTAGSVIDFGGFNVIPALTVALPLGAVFFGLFLISLMLEKEMAKFDEEQEAKAQLLQRSTTPPSRQQKPSPLAFVTQLKEKTL